MLEPDLSEVPKTNPFWQGHRVQFVSASTMSVAASVATSKGEKSKKFQSLNINNLYQVCRNSYSVMLERMSLGIFVYLTFFAASLLSGISDKAISAFCAPEARPAESGQDPHGQEGSGQSS